MNRGKLSHLRGIVALTLSGQQFVDGANDTRYEYFSGGWLDATVVTEELVADGYLIWVDGNGAPFEPDMDDLPTNVRPTALGIFTAIS